MSMSPRLLRPRQTGFDPKSISGLSLWLDAADSSTITKDTGVSQWRDKSTTGSLWAPVSGNTQPDTGTQSINGKNVIVFNGTNTSLTANITPLSTSLPLTFFIVQRVVTGTSNGYSYAVDNTSFAILQTSGTDGRLRIQMQGSDFVFEVVGNQVGINNIISLTVPSGVGTSATLRRNGVALTPDIATLKPTLTGGHFIGRRSGGFYLNGWIAEIIAYSAELNEGNRLSVERYLSQKWGITLA